MSLSKIIEREWAEAEISNTGTMLKCLLKTAAEILPGKLANNSIGYDLRTVWLFL
jgi:hypothetical protein